MADPTTPGLAVGGAVISRAEVLAHRRSPAHHLKDDLEQGSGADVALREVPFLTQVSLRAVPQGPAGQALEGALGAALPRHCGEVTTGPDGLEVVWLAPDEFLAVAPDEADSGVLAADYAAGLAAALGTHRGQVVDVSANRVTFELYGPRARSVLDKSVRLDLHPRVFPVGRAIATLLGATPAILWHTDETTWRVLVRSSFATHVAHWLLDGIREYVSGAGEVTT